MRRPHGAPHRASSCSAAARARGLAAILALGLMSGCIGMFKPATPEPPLNNNCSPDLQTDASSPTGLLATMVAAMAIKSRGRCAYAAVIADSVNDGVPYHALFPEEIVVERTNLDLPIPSWNRIHELAFYDDFMELTNGGLKLQWSDWQEAGSDSWDPSTSDSTLHRRYVITPNSGAELLAAGVADLVFRQLPSGRWTLVTWVDHLDPARPGDTATRLDLTVSQRRLEAYDALF